ncbi:serine hydrolase domain-containing protein [Aestuariibaculum lutulentum]|uniref:Beta-lactamase family protein n=1 Tax=Aestuariibaculum lutulentum TaxID=2920935 RepID=A0ABS9REF3_9FLAO|nr:serine hydrolase domain-containing protein [Aestuariibaculum lutulentum]MCH4551328.1 beta-lactamase family protein [Aestuariibaculum lutulentum]
MKLLFAPIFLFSVFITVAQTEPARIQKAQTIANDFLKKEHIPGMAISVSHNGKLIWSEGFGYSNLKTKTPVKPNETIFRIASISKSVTAVTLGKLVDDGIIDLNESVYYYLPDYPVKKYDFTVKQLAGNISGIRHYKNNKEYALNKKMGITEGLNLFKQDPLLWKPGTKYRYSSLGFVLLSEVIQTAAKIPFKNLVCDSVFSPLKMHHTSMEFSDAPVQNLTNFHKLNIAGKPVESKPVSNEYKVGAGGFLSTSEDIILFGNEFITPKIITQKTLSKLTTSQRLGNGYKTGYGMGLSIRTSINNTPKYYHTGGGMGSSSILCVYPDEGIVICVLTNLSGVSMVEFGNALEEVFLK